ncbi:hypothetical protein TSMEX_006660 [Taenia solium]|eukprot:TsM_000188800 transcript=TsM_000188800 gene=TsM_000188800
MRTLLLLTILTTMCCACNRCRGYFQPCGSDKDCCEGFDCYQIGSYRYRMQCLPCPSIGCAYFSEEPRVPQRNADASGEKKEEQGEDVKGIEVFGEEEHWVNGKTGRKNFLDVRKRKHCIEPSVVATDPTSFTLNRLTCSSIPSAVKMMNGKCMVYEATTMRPQLLAGPR